MEAEMNVQLDLFERIGKAYTNFKKSPKDRITITYLETRLESLEKLWNQFSSGHTSLIEGLMHAGVAKTDYGTKGVYDVTDELYLDYKCALKTALSNLKPQPTASSQIFSSPASKPSQVHLPKITIPTFSGHYTEWMSFRDLFVSLIHNNADIDNVQKLHYLKTQLRGEAEQLLRHVPITNDSYYDSWNILNKRYNNKQYLVNSILQRFFGQRNLTSESSNAIKDLLDLTNETLNALVSLGIDTGSWDVIIIYVVSQRLDPESRKQWEAKVSELVTASDQLPSIYGFKDFLETRYHSLEFLDSKPSSAYGQRQRTVTHNYNNVKANTIHALHVTQISCGYCKQDHNIRNCKEFVNLDHNSKRNFVQSHGLCFNCLRSNHSAKHCRNTASCQICHRRHHSLLHSKSGEQSTESNGSVGNQVVSQVESINAPEETHSFTSTNIASHFVKGVAQQVLLATAMVKAESRNDGEFQLLRALIDQGSQASFITQAAVQLLGLKSTPTKGIISGLGGEQGLTSRSIVELHISSRLNPGCVFQVSAYVLDKLTAYSPSTVVSVTSWPELEHIELADPEYHTSNKIDILLGAEVYSKIIDNGVIKCPSGSLVAQNTTLGWILSGQTRPGEKITCNVTSMHTQVEPEEQVTHGFFWTIEAELCNKPTILTDEEQRCEASTTTGEESRNIIRLPLQEDQPSCSDNRTGELDMRLQKDQHLKKEYTTLSNEELGVNRQEVEDNEKEKQTENLYLPDHAKVPEDKETSKVHIGFASVVVLVQAASKLEKWFSNYKAILEQVQEGESVKGKVKGWEVKLEAYNQIIGLTLNRRHDEFIHAGQLPPISAPVIKRKVISDIARFDDAKGWITPNITHLVTSKDDHGDGCRLWTVFSSSGLFRVTAYCRRFLEKQKACYTYLLKESIDVVLVILVENCQNKVFTGDVRDRHISQELISLST